MRTLTLPLLLAALLASPPLAAQDQNAVERLIDRIVANEQEFLTRMRPLQPLLETYVQELSEDGGPEADHYVVGKLDLREGVSHLTFLASSAFQKRGRLFPRRGGPPLTFSPAGFAQMIFPDLDEFNRRTYSFDYIRREFLGELRCLVFDVVPKDQKAPGKFVGRIWVEDRDCRIVRFNGTYTGSRIATVFFHFDSWRVNVAPGWYVPAFVYIEDANPVVRDGRKMRLKGQTRVWGYSAARTSKWDELTSILVEAENPVRDQSGARDVSPVESQRSWTRQAEENIIERLEKSGLLAPKGEVDQVLNTVVNNLMVTNDINLEVQCRVLLTTPLETFSIGRTIVISRGLLDVLPDEASLAVVLSDELAHVALGHRTETMFAFSDRTMFAETETLKSMRFARPTPEVEAANRRAMTILGNSPYQDKLSNAGLFLKALAARAPRLENLIEANLGNQLAGGNNLIRLADLARKAPPLEEAKVEQIAALPLGSRIRLDPWTNRITLIKTKPVALLSAREKMPFEVTPIVLHLTRVPSGPEAATAIPPATDK